MLTSRMRGRSLSNIVALFLGVLLLIRCRVGIVFSAIDAYLAGF